MRHWINLINESVEEPKQTQNKIVAKEAIVDSLPEQETKTTYTLHINGEAKLSMEDYEALIELIHELNKENHELQIDIKEKTVPKDSTYEGQLTETIRRVDGKYRLVSKSGKNLGTYDTKAGAEKREKQVQYFKHVKEDVEIVFLDENLHKWFKEKWVRFGPDGKIRGECARGSKKEGKPKCLPQAKAHAIGKKARKSAASKKRREDPNPERRGRAINVATKKKTNESVAEGNETENFVNKIMQAIQQYRKNMLAVYGEEDVRKAVIDAVDEYMSFKDDPELSEKFDVNDPYDLIHKAVQIERDLRDWHRRDLQEEQLDELKCWSGYTRVKGVPAGAPGSCKKKSVKESHEQCPECGGPMFTDLLLAEEKDACYRKVKSRYKVWPSAYASGALVQCRKVGASNWGKSKKKSTNETIELSVIRVESDNHRRYAEIRGLGNNMFEITAPHLPNERVVVEKLSSGKLKIQPEPGRMIISQLSLREFANEMANRPPPNTK